MRERYFHWLCGKRSKVKSCSLTSSGFQRRRGTPCAFTPPAPTEKYSARIEYRGCPPTDQTTESRCYLGPSQDTASATAKIAVDQVLCNLSNVRDTRCEIRDTRYEIRDTR